MRRILLLTLLGVLMATTVSARKPVDKAGKIQDGVFTDKKYGYSLTLNDEWKAKVAKNKSRFRLTLTQNNYDIPTHYAEAEDYTKVPRTVVFVGETKMSVPAFIDSLLSDSYKSEQKDEIYKEFEILNEHSGGGGLTREKLVPTGRKMVEIGGDRGLVWTGKVKYRNEVSVSASSIGAKRVYGGFTGSIIGVKKGDMIILFHTMCEENYFDTIQAEALRLATSLKWKE